MLFFFFCQAEDGVRALVRSRGLGDVYKRQVLFRPIATLLIVAISAPVPPSMGKLPLQAAASLDRAQGTKSIAQEAR